MTLDIEGGEGGSSEPQSEVAALRARVEVLEEETIRLRRMVAEQAAVLAEVVTPLIPITDRVVVMPLIGIVDEARAGEIISTLLQGVVKSRARVAILDVTGVAQADARTSQALVAAARTVELLGARVVLTGVRPEMARAFVELDVELAGIPTERTLQSGIARAIRIARGS